MMLPKQILVLTRPLPQLLPMDPMMNTPITQCRFRGRGLKRWRSGKCRRTVLSAQPRLDSLKLARLLAAACGKSAAAVLRAYSPAASNKTRSNDNSMTAGQRSKPPRELFLARQRANATPDATWSSSGCCSVRLFGRWSGGMPSFSLICAFTTSMVSDASASTVTVMVLPVSVITKSCMPPRKQATSNNLLLQL